MRTFNTLILALTVSVVTASATYYWVAKSHTPEAQGNITFKPQKHTSPNEKLNGSLNSDDLAPIISALSRLTKDIPKLRKSVESNKANYDLKLEALELAIKELSSEEETAESSVESGLTPDEEYQVSIAQAALEVERFDAAIDSEDRDDAWASSMEDNIASHFQNESYKGSTFSAPECKSTFCRFEAVHTDNESKDNFELIRRELPNSYHIQHFDNADGTSMSVMYLIKEGEEDTNIIFKSLGQS